MAPDLRAGILNAARALGINPLDLATVYSYETSGTFNPTIAGPVTKYGRHRGLLQWGEPQAQQYLGGDFSIPSQIRGTVAYLRNAGVKPGMGLLDIYSAVNAGRVGLYNRSDAGAGGAPGTVRDKVENQMAGHRKKAASMMSSLKPSDMAPMSLSGIGSPNVSPPGSDTLTGGAGGDNLTTGLGMTPEEAADMAALMQKKERRRNPFEGIDFGLAQAPRISGGGGDARASGNMLLEALNAPTAADMLLKKRLQGIR